MFSRIQSATLSGITFLIFGTITVFSLPTVNWTVPLLWAPVLLGALLPEIIAFNLRYIAVYAAVGSAWGALHRLPTRPAAFLTAIAIRFGLFSVLPLIAVLVLGYISEM